MKHRLPSIWNGERRGYVLRLVLLGSLHSIVAATLAWRLHAALHPSVQPANNAWAAAIVLTLGVLLFGVRAAENITAETLGQHYVVRLRARLLRHLFAAPLDPCQPPRLGITMARLVGDLGAVRNWVAQGYARALSAGIALAGLLVPLCLLAPIVGFTLAGLSAIAAVSATRIARHLGSEIRGLRATRGRFSNRLADALLAAPVLRHEGLAGGELSRLLRWGRRLGRSQIRRARWTALLRRLPDLVSGVALAALVPWAFAHRGGGISIAIPLLLIGMVSSQLRELAGAWTHWMNFVEARRRLGAALRRPTLPEPSDATHLTGIGPARLRFRDVALAPVFHYIHAQANEGDRIWITGPSGSGKTALVRLAARLVDPQFGSIQIDGTPLTDLGARELTHTVRLVSPDIPLLRGSVRRNLQGENRRADSQWFDQVVQCCDLAGPDPQLPEGLDTRLSEGGANLSCSLRARISLARAMVARPRLVLIDDPVFLLDPAARSILQRALATWNTTVLMVGSELVPPIAATRIWRLADGTLTVTNGTDTPFTSRPLTAMNEPASPPDRPLLTPVTSG